jgi:eukaryotic-like serine/threonine-protein kinase
VVYVGSRDRRIYALNEMTGVKKWSYRTGGSIHSSPAVANGMVYVGSTDGKLYCFSLDPGGVFSHGTTRADPALLIPDHRLELRDES